MDRIAFIPLTPLGDSILVMSELEEVRRLYSPCEITVFAIPLIAELFGNFRPCDRVVPLVGGIHGPVLLPDGFNETFDVVFNHGYEPWYTDMVRLLKAPGGKAYGMEEQYRSASECAEIFDRWVSVDFWKNVTLKRWPLVPHQMAELIRLVSPDFAGGPARLSPGNYRCERPRNAPERAFVLFLPGTSASFKVYPMAKIAALAATLDQMGLKPVFALGPQDGEIGAALREQGVKFFQNLPLAELAWLISKARLAIGNDSGPMHLAAAFDVPTLHFFSFSGADNWFCYDQGRHRVLMPECKRRDGLKCGDCSLTCLGKIPVVAAVREACDLLGADMSMVSRVAYFPQDLIGDALVWADQIEAFATFCFAKRRSSVETVVFCTKGVAELFECMAFCDKVVVYDPAVPWTSNEARGFGHFDLVVNTRYDADSMARVETLDHDEACGFENIDIPESLCQRIYRRYIPLGRWDDYKLRRKTSVTEQGAELVRLYDPDYHCIFVEFGKTEFVREAPPPIDIPRIVFVVGASDPAKSWGLGRFLEVARFAVQNGCRPLFLLGPLEQGYAPQVESAGFEAKINLPFRQIAGYFDPEYGTACVVGNDTGLMHLACALGAPSVTIMPFGTHFTWFPYAKDDRAPHTCLAPSCAAPMCINECTCVAECVGKISVTDVETAMLRVMDSPEFVPRHLSTTISHPS